MTTFALHRETENGDCGTFCKLFDTLAEAEAAAEAFRKEEPKTEFWAERFSG